MGLLDDIGNAISTAYNKVDAFGNQQAKDIGNYFTNPSYVSQNVGGPAALYGTGGPNAKTMPGVSSWVDQLSGAGAGPFAGGGGGGGSNASAASTKAKASGPDPLTAFTQTIQSVDPTVSTVQAKTLYNQYVLSQVNKPLSDFIQTHTNQPDPMQFQGFFAKTVQPYLQNLQQQYTAGANAGTAAMQRVLSESASSPAIQVLRDFLPMQQAQTAMMAPALSTSAVAGPEYDALLTQLQNTQKAQEQAHADMVAQVAANKVTQSGTGGAGGTNPYSGASVKAASGVK